MDRKLSKNCLPLLALSLGMAGWGLRRGLYAAAVDERGLLISCHPLELCLWCLTALALGCFVWVSRKPEPAGRYDESFPPSFPGGAGQVLCGAGILLTVLLDRPLTTNLESIWHILGFLSFPALMAAGFCRVRGKKAFFLFHLIPCLFLVIHMVDHYRSWSSDPQLQNYVFSLFACLSLMLFSFYQASFDTDLPHRRIMTAVGLGTIYFSAVSLGEGLFLNLGAIAWAMTGLPYEKGDKQ